MLQNHFGAGQDDVHVALEAETGVISLNEVSATNHLPQQERGKRKLTHTSEGFQHLLNLLRQLLFYRSLRPHSALHYCQ